ncbi:MAG TPA: hypothetical protein VFZ65_21500 [Planctomycetota bacterium]|nr:hypothetical protein [Planctomycetota bacterium]
MPSTTSPTGVRGGWLPVHSEWLDRRLPFLHGVHAGLGAAGAEVRLETIGAPGRSLTLLWARSPEPLVEAAEEWLLRTEKPADDHGEHWTGCVVIVCQRSRGFRVWTASEQEIAAWQKRRAPSWPFLAPRLAIVERTRVETYPRSTVEALELLPQVWRRIGPNPEPAVHEWVALDQSCGAGDVAALVALERGLQGLGLTTCRYEAAGDHTILALHAGTGSIDELEARIASALAGSRPPWLARYVPWSFTCGVKVHRAHGPAGSELRAWLERELGAPVDASRWSSGEVVLSVPVRFVARALELLRERDPA